MFFSYRWICTYTRGPQTSKDGFPASLQTPSFLKLHRIPCFWTSKMVLVHLSQTSTTPFAFFKQKRLHCLQPHIFPLPFPFFFLKTKNAQASGYSSRGKSRANFSAMTGAILGADPPGPKRRIGRIPKKRCF